MHPLAAGRADRPFGRRLVRPLIVVRRGPVLQSCGALLSLCAAACAMAIRPHGLVQIGSHTLPVPGKGLHVLTRGEEAQHLLKMPVSARVPCRQEGEQPAKSEPDCPQQMPARLFFFRHFLSPAPARPGRQRCRVFRAPLSHFVTRHPSFLQGCYFFFTLCYYSADATP